MMDWKLEAIEAALCAYHGKSWRGRYQETNNQMRDAMRETLNAAVKAQGIKLKTEAADATLEDEQAAHQDTLRLLKAAEQERDAAFADRDAETRERIYLEIEMRKRQPYDAATPFYPEKVTEGGILERLRGLGFSSMEREVERLMRERDEAREQAELCCAGQDDLKKEIEAAERKVERLREALRPFSFPRSEWGSKVYAINETISTDWITNARAALAE